MTPGRHHRKGGSTSSRLKMMRKLQPSKSPICCLPNIPKSKAPAFSVALLCLLPATEYLFLKTHFLKDCLVKAVSHTDTTFRRHIVWRHISEAPGIGNWQQPPIFKACARKFVFRKKKCLQKASSGGNSVEGGKFGCGKGVFALPHKCVFTKGIRWRPQKCYAQCRRNAKKKSRLLLLQTLQTLISYRRFSEQNHVQWFWLGKTNGCFQK